MCSQTKFSASKAYFSASAQSAVKNFTSSLKINFIAINAIEFSVILVLKFEQHLKHSDLKSIRI